MRNRRLVVLLVTLASSAAVLGSSANSAPEAEHYWPGWRGTLMTGTARIRRPGLRIDLNAD